MNKDSEFGRSRLHQLRQSYRSEIRKLDHLAMLKAKRQAMMESIEVHQFLNALIDSQSEPQQQLLRYLTERLQQPSFSEELILLMGQHDLRRLIFQNRPQLTPMHLKIILALTDGDNRNFETEIVLSYLSNLLIKDQLSQQSYHLSMSLIRNLLINRHHTEQTEIWFVQQGILRKIQQSHQKYQSHSIQLISVAIRLPKVQSYLAARNLEMCLLFRIAVNHMMNKQEDQHSAAYRIILELLTLNENFCRQFTKEQLQKLLQDLATERIHSNILLGILLVYCSSQSLAERFIRQKGLQTIFKYLSVENVTSRKLTSMVILNCVKFLSDRSEVRQFVAVEQVIERLLFMIQEDTTYVCTEVIGILTNLVRDYEPVFAQSLIQRGIVEALGNLSLQSPEEGTYRQEIFALAHCLQFKIIRKKINVLAILRKRCGKSEEEYQGKFSTFFGSMRK